MAVFQKTFQISTRGECDVVNISPQVSGAVKESAVRNGIVNVSARGSTVGITTIEFESGCVADLQRALEKIAPSGGEYAHNERWGDGNGYSHLRSALIGTSRGYPLSNGEIGLGTWQQIVLCDFDNRPRRREVTVTVIGE